MQFLFLWVNNILCNFIHLTKSVLNSSLSAVFHHREVGEEASDDWGFCNDGCVQCWNHSGLQFTGVCTHAYMYTCACSHHQKTRDDQKLLFATERVVAEFHLGQGCPNFIQGLQ